MRRRPSWALRTSLGAGSRAVLLVGLQDFVLLHMQTRHFTVYCMLPPITMPGRLLMYWMSAGRGPSWQDKGAAVTDMAAAGAQGT